MDSINKNQPEENRKDLQYQDAVEKIKELVEEAGSCFFCTVASGDSISGRPMNVRQVDAEGNLWFLSPADTIKNQEIENDPRVKLYFQGSSHSGFMELNGHATITRDRAKIKELWSPFIKTWFTEGIDDPRITVIKVTPSDGYYWDTKHGFAVAGAKMLIGAAIGKTLDDSIEGKLKI